MMGCLLLFVVRLLSHPGICPWVYLKSPMCSYITCAMNHCGVECLQRQWLFVKATESLIIIMLRLVIKNPEENKEVIGFTGCNQM